MLNMLNQGHQEHPLSDDRPRTLSEQRADLERQLRDLEAGNGIFVADQYPITPEAKAQQIDRLKAIIREIAEAQKNAPRS
jgi:hypothetical protein